VLTRIEIDGFKTFKDFALDVPPFGRQRETLQA